ETRPEGVGQCRSEDKPASFDADDGIDLSLAVVLLEAVDRGAKSAGVLEQGGDVVEEDAGLGEVGDFADERFQLLHGLGIVIWGVGGVQPSHRRAASSPKKFCSRLGDYPIVVDPVWIFELGFNSPAQETGEFAM